MAYIQAFFYGIPIKLARPGTKLTEKVRTKGTYEEVVKAEIPHDFFAEHPISTRDYEGI